MCKVVLRYIEGAPDLVHTAVAVVGSVPHAPLFSIFFFRSVGYCWGSQQVVVRILIFLAHLPHLPRCSAHSTLLKCPMRRSIVPHMLRTTTE